MSCEAAVAGGPVPQALLTFFVVFSGSCYSRYYALYGAPAREQSCAGWGCCEYSSMTRAPSKVEPEPARHCLGLHPLLHAGRRCPSGGKLRMRPSGRRDGTSHALCRGAQSGPLYEGFKPFLLQEWALQAVKSTRIRREALDRRRHRAFHGAGARVRKNCAETVSLLAQPVPFPYFHVINFMLSVNLVLVAYSLTFIDSIMTVPLFFIVCLCCTKLTCPSQGLRTVRTGYAYQPCAYCTYRRCRAARSQYSTRCMYWVAVPASGVPYVPRTVAHRGTSGAARPQGVRRRAR